MLTFVSKMNVATQINIHKRNVRIIDIQMSNPAVNNRNICHRNMQTLLRIKTKHARLYATKTFPLVKNHNNNDMNQPQIKFIQLKSLR